MVENRAVLLPLPEPMRVPRAPASLADVSLRPLRRGLVFLAALSLPVLGCAVADRFHGGASEAVQVVAVPLIPPQSGAAASTTAVGPARIGLALLPGTMLAPARFAGGKTIESMSLR